MKNTIKALLKNEDGTSAVEMGLICALIVLAMLTALQDFASGSISMWNNVTDKTAAAIGGATS